MAQNTDIVEEVGDDNDDVRKIMGFSGFGGEKKAKTFDLTAMLEQAKQTARARSQKTFDKWEEEKSYTAKPLLPESSTSVPKNKQTSESDEEIGPLVPPSLKENSTQQNESDDDDFIGPPIPTDLKNKNRVNNASITLAENVDNKMKGVKQSEDDEDDEADSDDDSDWDPLKKIPATHEILLKHGVKTVSAMGLDPSGARLVTGGYDYDVKFWDFAGMDASLRHFRQIRPCESHLIKSLEYSNTGEHILVAAGNAQPKVLDRDGYEVLECPKGDQYIVDMKNTKGHTAMVNSGCWNPQLKEEFMTCSNDGTVRLWDVTAEKPQKNVIKPKSQQGRRTFPSTCAYSRDGRWVAAACQDGSIQIWDHRKMFVNVAYMNRSAHQMGSETSCLCFSYDNNVIASRGGDDTVKTWDMRQFKKPLGEAKGLFNKFPMTDCVFSPDDKLIVTGVSLDRGDTEGKLVFLDRQTLKTVYEIIVSDSSVVRFIWHPKLNQMVAGCADGDVKLFYDHKKSLRGAKLCVVKTKRKIRESQVLASTHIITPHALPMFREARQTSTRKQEEKARKDPVRSHRPDLPVHGPGSGGRLGAKGATLSQYVAQQIVKRIPDERDKDPRAAILRHAKDAAENPYWVDPAYKASQPTAIFQTEDDEEKDDEDVPAWKKQKIT